MIKISASYVRKTPGAEQFSSESTHLTVEVELPDRLLSDQEQFSASARRLFAHVETTSEN